MKPHNLSVISCCVDLGLPRRGPRRSAETCFRSRSPGSAPPAKGSVVDVSWLNDGAGGPTRLRERQGRTFRRWQRQADPVPGHQFHLRKLLPRPRGGRSTRRAAGEPRHQLHPLPSHGQPGRPPRHLEAQHAEAQRAGPRSDGPARLLHRRAQAAGRLRGPQSARLARVLGGRGLSRRVDQPPAPRAHAALRQGRRQDQRPDDPHAARSTPACC